MGWCDMIRSKSLALTALLLTIARPTAAQPPRPTDPARSVTLSLAEYNRLIDLANRPRVLDGAPVASAPASADLRILVDRDTARGVFNIRGNALRAGISSVNLLSGATLIDANASGQPLPLVSDGNTHAAFVPGPGPFSLALD